jgi:hypothetical protein
VVYVSLRPGHVPPPCLISPNRNFMAMRPCNRCLESSWKYEFNEGLITATCQRCGAEVSFLSRKQKNAKNRMKNYVQPPPVFYPGFNTPGVPAATQPDPVHWAALEASFVDNDRAPWE